MYIEMQWIIHTSNYFLHFKCYAISIRVKGTMYIQKWLFYYKVKSEASSSETKTVIAAHTSLEYLSSVGGTGYFEGEVSSGDNYGWKECKNTYNLGWN